jgi:hypothetical protein
VPEPAPKPQPAVLQLTLDTQRGGEPAEELRQLAVPEGTEEVQIQVSLGGAEQDYAAFNASVRSSAAGEVWSRQGLLPQALDWGAALILGIPAEKLPDGRYEMEVQGVSVGGEAETIGVQEFEIVAD